MKMKNLKKLFEDFADGKINPLSIEFELPSFKIGTESVEEDLSTALEKSIEARKRFGKLYRRLGVVLGCILVGILILVTVNLPQTGIVDAPSNNEVYEKYVGEGLADTGAVNLVSGMILDYRAFDTLGESAVLFTAACAVIILLIGKNTSDPTAPSGDVVLRTATKILFPFIELLGIYIILNGHISPGGGFSGGAVMGAGFILFTNVFGVEMTGRFFNRRIFTFITSGALLSYAALKCYSFYTGANHIESHIPKGIPGAIISAGFILPLNIFVGLIVCCTMLAFYLLFTNGDF